MTRQEAIRCLSVHSSTNGSGLCTDKQHYKAKQMAIKALEQEPCDVSDTDVGKIDAVSRQAVLDLVSADWKYEGLESDIANLPSVNLQPKMGHWKQISPARIYECDICGQNVMTDDISAYRYCHGCGAKMIEPQESVAKRKVGIPREDYEPLYNCENWIP